MKKSELKQLISECIKEIHLLKEIGEMSRDSIQLGGEFYEWAKKLRLDVLNLVKLSKNKLTLLQIRPFDAYQGPYASVKINGNYDSIWTIGEENFLMIENLKWLGTVKQLGNALNGNT